MASALVGRIIANFIGTPGYVLGALVVLGCFILYGEDELWGEWKVPAAWGIAGYFLWNDVLSLCLEAYSGASGNVAHWAHIGGFCCGVVYAFMVGLTGEAKTEYITDEAEASLEMKHGGNAMESAEKLLKMKPNDPQAHRLMARALDARNKADDTEPALDAWETAIEKFLQAGDRDGAAKSYLEAVSHHKGFILQPRTQFLLGNHMARLGDHIGAAETLVKIPYTFPDAPEGELSLLRSAQLYAQHLHNPVLARQLLTTLLQRYPQTEWKAQVESGLKSMEAQLQNASQG
jgi:TolA-binding protein